MSPSTLWCMSCSDWCDRWVRYAFSASRQPNQDDSVTFETVTRNIFVLYQAFTGFNYSSHHRRYVGETGVGWNRGRLKHCVWFKEFATVHRWGCHWRSCDHPSTILPSLKRIRQGICSWETNLCFYTMKVDFHLSLKCLWCSVLYKESTQ